jgi:hypothetical protein
MEGFFSTSFVISTFGTAATAPYPLLSKMTAKQISKENSRKNKNEVERKKRVRRVREKERNECREAEKKGRKPQ